MSIFGYFAQPMSESKSIWTPDSYRYVNAVGQENIQIYATQFGSKVVYISTEDFQRSFKSDVMIISSTEGTEHKIYYLAEKESVTYVAKISYGNSLFLSGDKASLLKDGQLQLSYSTSWTGIILAILVSSLVSMIISLLCVSRVESAISNFQYWWKYKRAPSG